MYKPLHKFKESVDGILSQDMPQSGTLSKHAELPLLSHNLPAEFARLRAFLLGEVAEQR